MAVNHKVVGTRPPWKDMTYVNHKVEGSSNRAQNKQINGFFFFHKQIIKNVVEKEVFK